MGLDAVELVMSVEEVFDIQIPDSEAAPVLTPRDLSIVVESALNKQNRSVSRNKIDEEIKQISIELLSLGESEYHQDKEYVRDLGMD